MKKLIAMTILTCCLFLNSCVTATESDAARICAAYSIPGMLHMDLKCTKKRTIEVDNKGRVLYKYTAQNIIFDTYTTVLVIYQKYEDKNIYFYEDENYLFDTSSSEEIETFKARNDWNLELQPEKMSKRPLHVTIDSVMVIEPGKDNDRLEESINLEFQSKNEKIKLKNFDDSDFSGNALYYVETEIGKQTKKYFVISDVEYDLHLFEITDDVIDYEAFKEFKRQSGWRYGS